jgi:Spy/CpxP family protein refolding chaperone
METERTPRPTPESPPRAAGLRRPLIAWPLALVALTLAMLLVANTVSAWGRRSGEGLEDAKAHAEFLVSRALRRIDATDEQREAIQSIVAEAIDELASEHGERTPLRQEIEAVLAAETIDRAALERLRIEHLDRADRMSRIVARALADVLEQLTPEQRIQIEEHLEQRHGRRHRWH